MSCRILIVEDEQIIAEDLAFQVRRLGHDVLGISLSGFEAVDVARHTQPDVVFMDIQLEGDMTGIEAAQMIQESTGAQIVFITAFPGVLLREMPHLREPGICVNKPFSRNQLESALKAASSRRTGVKDVIEDSD